MPSLEIRANPLDCSEVTEQCPLSSSIYGYYPSLGANGFFAGLLALCFFIQLGLGIKYKTWTYMLAMTLACCAAAIGYGGRIILHSNPFDTDGFEIQICCLTMSPAFNSAAIYLMLKHIVRRFGREWSRLRPKYYTWGFITADILALCLQAIGGGMAGSAGDNMTQLNNGTNIMLAGICWQVATLVVFGIMITDYIVRRSRSASKLSDEAAITKKDIKFRLFSVALTISYFAVLIRCIYRIAEMAGGWQNPIMQDEGTFIACDSCMVALATILQTVFHPGYCFSTVAEVEISSDEVAEKILSDSSDTAMV